MLPLAGFLDAQASTDLQVRLNQAAHELPWFGKLRLLYG